ncbi:MAG: hypothetical protein EAX86_04475 [Candidatus Heimdallarchaeota archaeon]|nr:hypothetical protein [Candidatus Heimdallarchaeota archaeon]
MSGKTDTLFDKWINVRFDGKMVISVTQKGQYRNINLSMINGRSYKTKLGDAMSVQIGPSDLEEIITALTEVQSKFFPNKSE